MAGAKAALAEFVGRLPDTPTPGLRYIAEDLNRLTLKGRLDPIMSLLYQAEIAHELAVRGETLQ